MDNWLHRGDPRVIEKCRQRRADHRFTPELAILLGYVAARAQAPAARNDNRGNRLNHFTLRLKDRQRL
jgi:hypothetical protein